MPPAFTRQAAIVENRTTIDIGSRIWAFAHILNGAQIGDNCNICDHVFIKNDPRMALCVAMKCGVLLWDSLLLEDNVYTGTNLIFTSDPSN